MKISVSDILHSQNAVFHDDGLSVFSEVKSALEKGDTDIEVSFEHIKVCTTQFLNACFGKLLLAFGEETVKKTIHPVLYNSVNSFSDKYALVWENFQEKNKSFIEEAYA